jgi:hypothetical protein
MALTTPPENSCVSSRTGWIITDTNVKDILIGSSGAYISLMGEVEMTDKWMQGSDIINGDKGFPSLINPQFYDIWLLHYERQHT